MAEVVARESGIGGTDIGAIVGVSHFRKPWDVYAEKRGLAEPFEPSPRMKIGLAQQPTIVKLFEDETDHKVQWADVTVRHPKLHWAIGTPDGYIEPCGETELPPGFEAKTAGLDQAWRWGEEQDDVPEEYLVQCQWYMLVTGRKSWWIAALIGGDRFRTHLLQADEGLQGELIEAGARFWNRHVEQGIQPDLDTGRAARNYLKRMYPTATKEVREATPAELEEMRELSQVQGEIKMLAERKDLLKMRLESAIGSKYGVQGEGLKAIWYETKETTYTTTRPAGRVFKLTDKRRNDGEAD